MPVKAPFVEVTVVARTADNAERERVVAAALTTWHDAAAALSPVIGARGFTALYERSLRHAAASFPWLEAAADAVDGADPFAALRSALAQRPGAEAAAASTVLAAVFRELLDHLIGAALAQRLVGPQLPHASAVPMRAPGGAE